MSADEHIEQLVQAYLDGCASAAETAELASCMCDNPADDDAFTRATRFDALLEAHFVEERRADEWSATPIVVPLRPRRRATWVAVTAAAVAALALGWWWRHSDNARDIATLHRIVSGYVLVDGVEAETFSGGFQIEVVGPIAAFVHLAERVDVELAAATTAVVRKGTRGAVVTLNYGNGKFRSDDDRRTLCVDTPVGAISGQEAEFAVDLQATDRVEAASRGSGVPALLTVAVLAGQVEVLEADQPDQKVQVSAGESRAFSPEKKPMFAGRVVEVASDGKRLTLEGKPAKPGTPPQRREMQITEQTELTYYGMPQDGDRPTVGYAALATLDKAAPERAVAVEFGDKTPTLFGPVKEVSDEGRTVTIEVHRKGDEPLQRTIVLDQRTRTSYSGVASAEAKPTIGYQASVWLVGDSDRAAEIRFLFKAKGARPPRSAEAPKNPDAKKPAPTVKPMAKPLAPKEMPAPQPKVAPKPATKPVTKPEPKTAATTTSDKPNPKLSLRRPSTRDPLPIADEIDREIDRRLAEAKKVASPQADDAEFLRRVALDITGQIPTYAAARTFLDDRTSDKRRKLIDALLADPAYGRRFGAVWKRLIQPKPATSGKPQIDKVTPWLAEQFNQNRGWDEVVRELLTTEANLARDPQGYFLAVNSESFDPKPNLLAASTARLFLGVQLGCAECHNHPFAAWRQTEFWNLAAFFSRLHKRSKSDFALTEETDELPPTAEIMIPEGSKEAGTMVPARFLGGGAPKLEESVPLRNLLADWITAQDNPYFARAAVNRLWAQFFGRGLVEPLDGFQEDYAPSHPEVLDRLASEFTASNYDVQHIIRILCNTRAYQRTSRPLPENEHDAELLSHMAVKVLSPALLYDSLTLAVNGHLESIAIPGKNGKVAQRETVSIGPRDEFVNFFSGPAAESSANEFAHGIPQLLRLMNAEALNVGAPLAKALAVHNATLDEKIDMLYVTVLSRRPSREELDALKAYVTARQGNEQAYAGALWILLNTSEFVLNH